MVRQAVYIIIPVHNRKNITLKCLENLKKFGDLQRYHVIIIDDGSTDGTTDAIHELYPNVIVLSGDGNLWWTGAIKKGMEYAYEQGAEFFIWLNDDCIPDYRTLSLLVTYLQKHPDTIVGVTCYSPEYNLPLESGFRGRKRLTAKPNEVVFVDGLSGYCVGIPVLVVQQVGYPNFNCFPHYAGDGMYILKATKAGFKVCILGAAKVILPGVINSIHSLQNYLLKDASINFTSLFWSKKSPYYIPMQFFYHLEKYGILGNLLFIAKLIYWLEQWSWHKFTGWSRYE